MPRTYADLEDWPVVVEIPVQWGELDAYGHVNNTVFFRWFESARIAFLDRCGLLETMERDRIGAILHSTSCRFRRAVFFPDTVLVGGAAADVGDDRFTMQYRVVSVEQDAVAAEGEGVIVSYDYTRRNKVLLPDAVRQTLRDLAPPG